MHQHLSFDLDGTIVDSKSSINAAVKHAMMDLDFEYNDQIVAGASLDDLMNKLNINNDDKIKLIKERFIFHYDRHYCIETQLFFGFKETLVTLSQRNVELTLVTNKRSAPTLKILRQLGLNSLFKKVWCIDSSSKLCNKSQILQYIRVSGARNIYIGDLDTDHIAAQNANYEFFHASWGYGAPAGHHFLENSEEILDLIQVGI